MSSRLPYGHLVMVLATCAAASHALAETRPASRPADGGESSLAGARSEVYKEIGGIKLNIHIFCPPDHNPDQKRPAIVFFFGGGWLRGTPAQFGPQCEYLASRGMVAMAAEYRVYERHKAMVADCVADAQSAIRWVRRHAKRLGVDPGHIAAGGGSAGGHLAAATGTLEDFTGNGEDSSVSAQPDALVLFNPALSLLSVAEKTGRRGDRVSVKGRLGASPEALSPIAHVTRGTPPTIIFHGEADKVIPYAQMEAFAAKMKESGNRCELVGFPGEGHGFFNYARPDKGNFIATTKRADQFLTSLGYLRGEPAVEAFVRQAARTDLRRTRPSRP